MNAYMDEFTGQNIARYQHTTVTARATAAQKAAIIMIQKGGREKHNRVQRESKIKN